MKKSLLVIASIISVGFATAVSAAEQLDKIVAVVNDDIVTQSEVESALRVTKAQMEQQHIALPGELALEKQVVDQVINKKIQLQVAKTVGINVKEAELDSAINKIATQNNITDAELYTRVAQEGYSVNQYRGELREQLTVQKLQQQEVVSHIVIPPEEVNAFLSSKAWVNNSNSEYHLEDILVPVSDTPTPTELETAKLKAEALLTKIKNSGSTFHDIAKSEALKTSVGGDLGWRSLAEIPDAFGDEVVHMQKNQISTPIQTANGYHLIRLVDARKTDNQPAPDRKQVENFLMQRKFQEAVQNWVSKLRGQAYIVVNTEKA